MSHYRHYPGGDLELEEDVPGARYFAVSLRHTMLTYFELEPRTTFPEHSHDSEQITLVLGGRLVFVIAGERVVVRAGEAIALPSNVPHAVHSLEEPVQAVDAWSPPRAAYR